MVGEGRAVGLLRAPRSKGFLRVLWEDWTRAEGGPKIFEDGGPLRLSVAPEELFDIDKESLVELERRRQPAMSHKSKTVLAVLT